MEDNVGLGPLSFGAAVTATLTSSLFPRLAVRADSVLSNLEVVTVPELVMMATEVDVAIVLEIYWCGSIVECNDAL